jgi:hypothetical protein
MSQENVEVVRACGLCPWVTRAMMVAWPTTESGWERPSTRQPTFITRRALPIRSRLRRARPGGWAQSR